MVSAHLDGLIIVDEAGKPIVQTSFRNTPAAYPLLHLDAFNQAQERARTSNSYPMKIDPILPVNVPASADRPSSVLCHVERGGINFLCPVSADVEPSFVFAFTETFISILEEYLGGISSSLIKDHFDVVYQLLEEMLDNGIPLTTEPNTLRDIVLPPSLLNKMLSVAGVAGLPTSAPAPFSSPIPWRKTGLRYTNNDIYMDIVETLDMVVSGAGKVLTNEIYGKIQCDAKLSGTPDLLLVFGNPQVIADPSFHPCVRVARFMNKKELSFVPPDGSFTIMEYRVASPQGSGIGRGTTPVILKPDIKLTDDGGAFEMSASSKSSANKMLENVTISLFLGRGSGSVMATIGLGNFVSGLGQGGVFPSKGKSKDGSWDFNPRTHVLRWEIPALDSHVRSIKGTFVSTERPPRPSRSVHITFQQPTESLSGIRVDHMKILNENYKAHKGVRMSSKGEVEWRL